MCSYLFWRACKPERAKYGCLWGRLEWLQSDPPLIRPPPFLPQRSYNLRPRRDKLIHFSCRQWPCFSASASVFDDACVPGSWAQMTHRDVLWVAMLSSLFYKSGNINKCNWNLFTFRLYTKPVLEGQNPAGSAWVWFWAQSGWNVCVHVFSQKSKTMTSGLVIVLCHKAQVGCRIAKVSLWSISQYLLAPLRMWHVWNQLHEDVGWPLPWVTSFFSAWIKVENWMSWIQIDNCKEN